MQHSVKVYQVMMEKHFEEGADNPESFAVCALLHDLCKAQFYKCSTRNVKNEAHTKKAEEYEGGSEKMEKPGKKRKFWFQFWK